MKLSRLLVYLIVLLFVAGYVYLVEIKQKETKEAEEKKASKIVRLDKDKVVEILLQTGEKGRIELKKPAETWVVTEPVKALADEVQVKSLLKTADEATAERTILEKDVDWKEYGLDKPEFTASLFTADKQHTIAFGAKNPSKTSYYCRVDDGPKLYLVADTLKNALNKSTFDVRDKVVVNVAPEVINRIAVSRKGSEVELERKEGSPWEMVRPEKFKVKSASIDQALVALTNLNAKEIIDDPKKEGDPYGLDHPEEKILIAGKDQEYTLLVGKGQEQDPKAPPRSNRYVRMKGHDTVFLVDGKALASFKSDPDQLRDRSLLAFKPLDVNRLEVTLDGTKWVAARDKDKKWSLEEPEKRESLESWPVTAILWDLRDLEWKKMDKALPTDMGSVHLDKPQLTVTLNAGEGKSPLVMKAGWEPVVAPNPASAAPEKAQSEAPAATEPGEKQAPEAKKAEEKPPAVPATTLPPTCNVLVEPHEEGQVLFTVDSGFITRLRGDLQQLLQKK
jgi:hypothetical protein